MSPLGLVFIGSGIVLIFAAFKDVSPVELVLTTLGVAPAHASRSETDPNVPSAVPGSSQHRVLAGNT